MPYRHIKWPSVSHILPAVPETGSKKKDLKRWEQQYAANSRSGAGTRHQRLTGQQAQARQEELKFRPQTTRSLAYYDARYAKAEGQQKRQSARLGILSPAQFEYDIPLTPNTRTKKPGRMRARSDRRDYLFNLREKTPEDSARIIDALAGLWN